MVIESELTVAKAMKSISLKKLDKTIGRRNILKSITYLLMRLSNNFNMKGKFTAEQSAILSMDLFEVFGHETLEDVMLMFKYARQGKIGDGKDFKLDSQTVFHKWVPAYLELKSIEREKNHDKKKGEVSGLANFKWDKENLEKFEVSKEQKLPGSTLGSRLKSSFASDHLEKPKPVKLNRAEFYDKAKADVKNHKTEHLKTYIKAEKSSQVPDQILIKIVESELRSRKNKLNHA